MLTTARAVTRSAWVLAVGAVAGALLVGCSASSRPGFDGASSARVTAGDSASGSTGAGGTVSPGVDGGAPGQAQASDDVLGRKVIRNGTLELEVRSVAEAYDRVSVIATSVGGYVQEGTFAGGSAPTTAGRTTGADVAPDRTARLVLRVPAARYEEAVASLRGVAENVRGIGVNTQDVTAEVTDLEATISNLRAVEAQYVQLLGRAQAISDVITVQEKVRQVRLEIERAQARLALTTRLTDLATITVRISPLSPPAPSLEPPGPLAAARMGWDASLEVLRVTVSAVVLVAVFSWWLVPVVACSVLVVRWLRRRLTAPGRVV